MGKMRKRGKLIGRVVTALVLALMVSSCGYQLVGGKGIYGGDIKTISLSAFKNATYEPHVSFYVTNAFSRELATMGLFDLNAPNADAYLEGTIRRIIISPSAMSSAGLVIEKQASMNVEIALYRKNGSFIKKWTFNDTEPYVVNDVAAEDYNKRNAIEVISGRVARKFSAALLVEY
jgi:hypothetical protein